MRKGLVDLSVISLSPQELETFCRANGIHRLLLFGSAVSDRFGPESDIDLLVEFEADAQIGFMALGRMQRQLAATLGRPVDLVPIRGLKPLIRNEILETAQTIYHAA
ncbi:MAG: nucleotidyltransferase domain-containing protein [Caldilineaceae bacterium]|nr:nucleotidyltransferase domain-containing protein [Caldilineaceae bacterium]